MSRPPIYLVNSTSDDRGPLLRYPGQQGVPLIVNIEGTYWAFTIIETDAADRLTTTLATSRLGLV